MAGIRFSKEEQMLLLRNKNVTKVTDKSITYSDEFKVNSIQSYSKGKFPVEIFREAGFDLNIIGNKNPKRYINRWKITYLTIGKDGLTGEKRGRGGKHHKILEMSLEKRLAASEAKVSYLEMENEFLKIRRVGKDGCKVVTVLPSDKYGIIKRIYLKYKKNRRLTKGNLTISIKRLCQIASVSISGYYKWKSNENNRIARLEKEIADYEIIYKIFTNHQETVGYRTITMELKQHYSIIMNHKKVIRLMKKYKLKCKIRRKRTYGNTFDKNRIEHTYPNLTNTKFDCVKPYFVLHTDITYIKFAYFGKTAYLSAIKDQTTRKILAYKISNSIEVSFVIETIKALKPYPLAKNTIIHSDQGVHYSSKKYNEITSIMGLSASMSRRGKCVDNAPIETFFGHMKDEVNFNILQTLEELVEIIDKYIYYYNNNRPQWTLKKMTPIEYRNHLLSVS